MEDVQIDSRTLSLNWIEVEPDADLRIQPAQVGMDGRLNLDDAHVSGTFALRVAPQRGVAGKLQIQYLTIATGGDFQVYLSLSAEYEVSFTGSPHVVIFDCVQQPGATVLFDKRLLDAGVIEAEASDLNAEIRYAELRGLDPRADPSEVA